MMNKNTLRFSAVIACFFSLTAQALMSTVTSNDPLFLKMQGQWKGEGTRTYPISGRITQVVAAVTSSVSMVNGHERLNSDNEITETATGAVPQTYESDYWIEATPGQTGEYSLGTGEAASTSTGSLTQEGDSMAFVSDQGLGNDYNIHSETVFNQLGPLFTETVTDGNQVILQSVIQYRRVQ